jgi:hypothetical protein
MRATMRQGRRGWFYFCFHCRGNLGEGRHCNECPLENNLETRKLVRNRRNTYNRRNPIYRTQSVTD